MLLLLSMPIGCIIVCFFKAPQPVPSLKDWTIWEFNLHFGPPESRLKIFMVSKIGR